MPQALEAARTWWKARPLLARAHVVHLHSSTWMNQVAARLAVREGSGGLPLAGTAPTCFR